LLISKVIIFELEKSFTGTLEEVVIK
jgi:hypothetical protein